MRPKPVKDVKTFDGKLHEVDIRLTEKSYTAWAFVESRLIEGHRASTQEKAVVSWKKEYQAALDPTPPKPAKPKKAKKEAAAAEVAETEVEVAETEAVEAEAETDATEVEAADTEATETEASLPTA